MHSRRNAQLQRIWMLRCSITPVVVSSIHRGCGSGGRDVFYEQRSDVCPSSDWRSLCATADTVPPLPATTCNPASSICSRKNVVQYERTRSQDRRNTQDKHWARIGRAGPATVRPSYLFGGSAPRRRTCPRQQKPRARNSEVDLLGKSQRVINLDTEVANRALQFSVAE